MNYHLHLYSYLRFIEELSNDFVQISIDEMQHKACINLDLVQISKITASLKLSKATDKEIKEFKKVANELYTKDEEVQIVISRELRQMERQTGKTFEL